MKSPVRIRIALIYPSSTRRAADPGRVAALTESIEEIGLRTPITVRPITKVSDGREIDAYEIVAGHHRYDVACALGWDEIDAVVSDDDELHAELWEIDENLMRAELTPADRAVCISRRKEIYELLHPETKQHVSGGKARQNSASDKMSFAAETAKATGKDVRTVQRDAQRGAKIAPDVLANVRGTPLDKGTFLDELKTLPPEAQRARVDQELGRLARNEQALTTEAEERRREARTAKERAHMEVCDFLLDRLTSPDWDHLIDLLERAGGSLKASDLRKWQSPSAAA